MPTPHARSGPGLVDYTLFVPNTHAIDHEFTPSIPVGTWTASIDAPNADPIDLTVNVASDVATVSFPDLSAYVNRTGNRLRLRVNGQVYLEGPVKLTAHGIGQQTTGVSVAVEDATVVSITVTGSPGVGVPPGGTTGQRLTKASDDDYDTDWETPSASEAFASTDSATIDFSGAGTAADPLTGSVKASSITTGMLAFDPATQAELDAEAALARNADNLTSGTLADARIAATIARDAEVTTAIAAEATARDTAIAAAIAALIASAPGVLDTLDEIAAAIGDDANFAATMTTALAGKQGLDDELTALAGLVSAANKLPYFTGLGAAATTDFTAFARTLLDDPDAATMIATLGLGTIATQAANNVAITGGSITGITDLAVADGGTGASNASGARTNLGLAIGTDVQAWDADLDALAARWTTATTTNPSQLAFREGTNNGTNEIVVKGQANISSDKTITLPDLTGTVIVAAGTAAQGDVLYFDGTNWVRLAAGTSGQFLKTNGAGANPAWATASSSGAASDPFGYGFPCTGPLSNARSQDATTVPDGSNRAMYLRVAGSGSITKVAIRVGTSSGNISIAGYTNSGGGRSAQPTGGRIFTTGAVACPASGYAEVSLGGTYTINAGDWFGLSCDNTTATFWILAPVQPADDNIALGVAFKQATAHPCPSTPSSLTAHQGRTFMMIGVA